MSSTTERVADALNTKKNVGESPVKRSYAKLRHPMRAQVSGLAAEKAQDESTDSPDGKHVATEEYTTASSHAAIKEMTTYLSEDEGQDALKKIFMGLGQVLYDGVMPLLLSDELPLQLGKASLMAGREVVSGSSDGLQSKLSTLSEKLPKFVTYLILPVIAVSGGLLMLGLLLALWRFAIFGL